MGVNVPAWRVTLDGADLTAKIRPRLVSLTLSEKRGDEADQLDIVLDDSDGGLAIPPEGAVLVVALGWESGPDVTVGLAEKGAFKVDEVTHTGPPDTVRIRARAADFTSKIRNRRETSWKDTTLGAVLRDVAGRNSLKPSIARDLAAIALAVVTQSRESDLAFIKRLGREHDAVATIKAGALIVTRKGSAKTAGGKDLPALTFTRRSGDSHTWTRQKREGQAGVAASWHDKKSAKRQTFTVGQADGAKKLRKVYPTEDAAKRAAVAERDRLKRAPASLDLRLTLGQPSAMPESKVTVNGFKPDIDGGAWIISEATHRLTGGNGGGLTTDLKLETAA